MLEVFINFTCSSIMSLCGFIVIKKIIKSKERLFKLKNILFLLLLAGTVLIIHNNEYNGLYSITVLALDIIIYKMIFGIKFEESVIACGILMFLLFIGDLLISTIFRQFLNIDEIRNTWYIYLTTNLLVLVTELIIVNIKILLKQFQNFYFNVSKKQSISNVIFLILLIIGLCSLAQNITATKNLNLNYFTNITIMIIFFCITYMFVKSRNNYTDLSLQYDNLFTYIQNFEDWIEKEQLNRHEYKNQLAVLRCLTKEKKVKDKIDEILEDNINIEGEVVQQLKSLPKGGLKGLMYYKSAIAQKNKISLTINVSIEKKSILNQLTEKDIRILCKLIGIYFDNAIEAAQETRKKIVLIEIYELTNKVNIVFSNTFKQHKNFKNRNQKGTSSKGEGHGNGLYFADKLISQNKWLSQKQEIIDKYYIQEISIHNKKDLTALSK